MAIPNWLTLSTESGNSGTTIVVLTADTNTTYNQRSYVFNVETDNIGKQRQVQIIQNASGADDYSKDYLTFEIISGGTIKLGLANLYYSKNGGDWTPLTNGHSINVQAGDEIEWKGDGAGTTGFPSIFSGGTAYFNVYGNIASLRRMDNFQGVTEMDEHNVYDYWNCFLNTNVVDAGDLILPYTKFNIGGYSGLFYLCKKLIKAPVLPATTLTESCYEHMFAGCTSLTTAPDLPATTLAKECYADMFWKCTSLTTPPIISANKMEKMSCYAMFSGCTSLTTAPELPATILGEQCYWNMFLGCRNLTTAPNLPATMLENECYYRMFANCTALENPPTVSAVVLASGCCRDMFIECSNLKKSPDLLAPIMEIGCYQGMFQYCSNLKSIKCLAEDFSANKCIEGWAYAVGGGGTFYKKAGVTWPDGGIPGGWTVIEVY